MPAETTTRAATQDDCDAVSNLLRIVDEHHVRLRPDVFRSFDDPAAMLKRVMGFLADEDAEIILAEVDHNVVGLATVQIHDNPDAPMFRSGRRAIMSDLVVHPESRRSGIGKQLLDQVVEWSRARGFGSLGLNVWNVNEDAVSFFAASGFEPRCQQMELKIGD